jgi:hypothetical protein
VTRGVAGEGPIDGGASLYRYGVHGLRLGTPFLCPELVPATGEPGVPTDVVVRLGATPERLAAPAQRGAAFEVTPDELLLTVPRVGRFHVRAGREVTIAPDDRADEDALRVLLLGSCLGAVLHQRGVLALHASAVRTHAGAVLVLGHSGAGKSTLAAALARRGATVLGDDLAAIVRGADGRPAVLPGVARLKLWADVAARFVADVAGLRPVRSGIEKFALPSDGAAPAAPTPVRCAYVLEPHNESALRLEPLDGTERFAELTRHTYRYRFIDGATARGTHFRLAALTAAHVAMTRASRPRHPFLLDELADRVALDVGAPRATDRA